MGGKQTIVVNLDYKRKFEIKMMKAYLLFLALFGVIAVAYGAGGLRGGENDVALPEEEQMYFGPYAPEDFDPDDEEGRDLQRKYGGYGYGGYGYGRGGYGYGGYGGYGRGGYGGYGAYGRGYGRVGAVYGGYGGYGGFGGYGRGYKYSF